MYPDYNNYTNPHYIPHANGLQDYTMATYGSQNAFQASQMLQSNQIYVNKSFVQPPTTKTVLVNPNFRKQVHVNPNFTKNNTVFVNPNVFNKVKTVNTSTMANPSISTNSIYSTTKNHTVVNSTSSSTTFVKNKPQNQPIISKYSKINNHEVKNQTNFVVNNQKSSLINNPIVKTKTKLIRVQSTGIPTNVLTNSASLLEKSKNLEVKNPLGPKSIISRHKLIRHKPTNINMKVEKVQKVNNMKNISKSKYKFIRNSDNVIIPPRNQKSRMRKLSLTKLNTSNQNIVKNRFKLDNRTRRTSCTIIKSRFKLTKKAYMMRLDPKNTIIKNTKFKLIRNMKQSRSNNLSLCNRFIKKNAMNLSLLKKKKFMKPNLVKINRRKLQKNNIPCEIYNKRGVCKGLASGKCTKKHDPNQIQICIWFLQGICRDDNCKLSHKASPEKMPTCKFYLEGICHKDNCPYLHVKLSKNAPVCRDFLNGYCAKAHECDKRHQFLCPDFERDGKCAKKLCRYPHGKAVRQYKDTLLNVIARNRKSKAQRKSKVRSLNASLLTHEIKKCDNESSDSKRYYECPSDSNNVVENAEKTIKMVSETSKMASNEDVTNRNNSIFDRPKLGTLPAFISL